MKIPAGDFCSRQREAAATARTDREFTDFLSAYADPLAVIASGPNAGKTKPTAFYMIAGQQKLLEIVAEIAERTTAKHLRECLFFPWLYNNPVEKLWWHLKGYAAANRCCRSMEELITVVTRYLDSMTLADVCSVGSSFISIQQIGPVDSKTAC